MTSTKKRKLGNESVVENEFNRLGGDSMLDMADNYQKAAQIPYDYKHMDDMILQYSEQCLESLPEPKLICCPRSYEEDFLREPIGNERACVKNTACQGQCITGATGFILREFILPGEEKASNSPRSLCLMCRRYEISRQHFLYESRESSLKECITCSPYYNVVGVPDSNPQSKLAHKIWTNDIKQVRRLALYNSAVDVERVDQVCALCVVLWWRSSCCAKVSPDHWPLHRTRMV